MATAPEAAGLDLGAAPYAPPPPELVLLFGEDDVLEELSEPPHAAIVPAPSPAGMGRIPSFMSSRPPGGVRSFPAFVRMPPRCRGSIPRRSCATSTRST